MSTQLDYRAYADCREALRRLRRETIAIAARHGIDPQTQHALLLFSGSLQPQEDDVTDILNHLDNFAPAP
jgi:hypothetical protein